MLKTKIKISKVSNLTDARYFAAMGVDYLGFCCNTGTEMYCSPQKIREITDWVEGPQFVLEFDGWQSENDIKELISSGLGQALHFGIISTYSDNFEIPVFKDIILENIDETNFEQIDFPVIRSEKSFNEMGSKDIAGINKVMEKFNAFLDIHFEPKELKSLIQNINAFGLILRGGEEEKTGFKSYEELDDIFDFLS